MRRVEKVAPVANVSPKTGAAIPKRKVEGNAVDAENLGYICEPYTYSGEAEKQQPAGTVG